MKKTIALITVALILGAMSANAQFNLKDVLSGGSSSSDSKSSTLGSVLGGVIDSVTGTSDIDLDKLTGTWAYSSPAVTLESDNALQKIGGSAATSVIENKLAPYYKTLGLNKVVLTIEADHSFTMQAGFGNLSGTIEKNDTEGLIFNFKAFQKINIGKVKTMASLSATGLTITFDVSKLKSVVDKAAQLSKNSTVKSVSSLLSSYDGIYAGFKLTKSK